MEALMSSLSFWFLVWMFSSAPTIILPVLGQDLNTAGFISIDCGIPNGRNDTDLRIYYEHDDGFVDSGHNMVVSEEFIRRPLRRSLKTSRVFPNGTRNCYTVRPTGGHSKYLIRASFIYGDYDGRNQTPTFDLHVGVNYWATVKFPSPANYILHKEIIHIVPSNNDAIIQVCLVNTGNGTPFISSLELRALNNTIYQTDATTLALYWRSNIGSNTTLRYPYDVYDRLWEADGLSYTHREFGAWNKSSDPVLDRRNDLYHVPIEALKTFVMGNSQGPFYFEFEVPITINKWIIYFHFAEMMLESPLREFTIYINGEFLANITFEYLVPVTAFKLFSTSDSKFDFQFTPTNANRFPILNAIEIYRPLDLPNTETYFEDVNAINDIKRMYGMNKDGWQGDPCVPNKYVWDGLTCSDTNPPKIMSLNLSSSRMTGEIAAPFSNLLALESLDLSDNQLNGPIPEFLAKLPNLKVLDLSGNNLAGSIPETLQKKVDNRELQIRSGQELTCRLLSGRLASNPNLCLKDFCKPKRRRNSFIIPVLAAASSSVTVLLIAVAIIRRIATKNHKGIREGTIKLRNRPFTYSEVVKITDNLKTVIGEGGSGKVYIGTLENGTKVAVKILSRTSRQGYNEFQAVAELLMIVHHRNLVSLVGNCDEPENMALIYEFMVKGNLQHLLDQSIHGAILSWKERIQIAIDAAQGLDYLHNGCRPPIIHRDLKPANILLNESMQAKIADFGLSKVFASENDSHISTRPAGTPGYLDPEFQSSGNLNRKSDVYSFGIILFELITGHHAAIRTVDGHIHIVQWVTPIIERGDIQSMVDPRLNGKFNVNSGWKFVEIAKSCVPPKAIQRPDISHVLAELKECYAIEMASGGSQSTGCSEKRSAERFGMTSGAVGDSSVPTPRYPYILSVYV